MQLSRSGLAFSYPLLRFRNPYENWLVTEVYLDCASKHLCSWSFQDTMEIQSIDAGQPRILCTHTNSVKEVDLDQI